MTELSEFADEVYEPEVRVEDQDLRLLKALVTDDNAARQIASVYGTNLFMGDASPFANVALSYFKTHNNLPTRRVMTEADAPSSFDHIWDELDRLEYNKSEFSYDLDKIKDRYVKQEVFGLRRDLDSLDHSSNAEEILRNARARLDNAEKIKRGKEIAYTQKTLKNYMPEFKEEFKAKVNNPNLGRGIMTGFSYLDYVTNGLQPTDMLIVGAETGGGKALPLDLPIPTPSGFKRMDSLRPGDDIFGKDGKIYQVVGESKVFDDPCWKFTFNDGTEIISHENHEWFTINHAEQVLYSRGNENAGSIRTSKEIAATLKCGARNNHAIPLNNPLQLPNKDLKIDPYLLGYWLGDGASLDGRITTQDFEIVEEFKKFGFKHSKTYDKYNGKAKTFSFLGLKSVLCEYDLIGNKHIPEEFLWGSYEQRLGLVQGLMDSDGTARNESGGCSFSNTNKSIIDGFCQLLSSLGILHKISSRVGKYQGKECKKSWRVNFTTSIPVFRLNRKLSKQNLNPRLNRFRYIVDAIKVEGVKTKCIEVNSPDHLFLAGELMIPTHNSMFLANVAAQIWMQENTLDNPKVSPGKNVLYFSLEMPFDQCARRTFARLSQISTYSLRDAHINKDQAKRLAKVDKFIEDYESEFEIVDIPRGVTVDSVEERFLESIAKGHRPDVVVVDYIGLMSAPDINGEDWFKLGEIAGRLHEFARAHNIIVLTAVQLNRPKGKDPNDIIGLHRIGRSSNIMHHASIGIQIETRPDEDTYADMPYHIIKNRNGERGHAILKKQFQYATLIDQDTYRPQRDDGIGAFSPANAMEDLTETLKGLGW